MLQELFQGHFIKKCNLEIKIYGQQVRIKREVNNRISHNVQNPIISHTQRQETQRELHQKILINQN